MKKIFGLLFVLTGCMSASFDVNVDALSQSQNVLSKYNNCYVTTKNKNIDEASLVYKSYYAYIEQALKNNNVKLVGNKNNANCLIYIDYGISEPTEKARIDNTPQYGITGYSSSNTSGNISGAGSFNTSTTYTPQYGITGYTQSVSYIKEYNRFLSMDARRKDNNEQLWAVNVDSIGESGDLRYVFPYLAYVASEKIKTSTATKETYKIKVDDERVANYKNSLILGE